METAIAPEYAPPSCAVRWEQVWTGQHRSLCVIVEYAEGSSHYYITTSTVPTVSELDSAHMLRRVSISMDDYTAAVRRAAAQAFDRQYAGFDPAIGGGAAYLLQLRAMTVAAARNSPITSFLPDETARCAFPHPGSHRRGRMVYDALTVSFRLQRARTGAHPVQFQ